MTAPIMIALAIWLLLDLYGSHVKAKKIKELQKRILNLEYSPKVTESDLCSIMEFVIKRNELNAEAQMEELDKMAHVLQKQINEVNSDRLELKIDVKNLTNMVDFLQEDKSKEQLLPELNDLWTSSRMKGSISLVEGHFMLNTVGKDLKEVTLNLGTQADLVEQKIKDILTGTCL